METEIINPMVVKADGMEYTLDFSRESVAFAESRGFKIAELGDYPQTNIPALWYYAFRKNHRNVSREKTDKLLERMGGLTEKQLLRLGQLYNQTNTALLGGDEEEQKNAGVTIEL